MCDTPENRQILVGLLACGLTGCFISALVCFLIHWFDINIDIDV